MSNQPLNNRSETEGRTERGTFAPGNKLSPGRPPGARKRASLVVDGLLEDQAEALVKKTIEAALDGDVAALRICLDRLSPPQKSKPIQVQLPDTSNADGIEKAHAAVIQAVADGEISPDEGTALAGMLEARRKAVETHDFARRLAMIETAIAGKDEA